MERKSLVGELSLCWGSMEGLGLRELAETAAAAGFAAITVNPPMYEDARAGGLSERDIQNILTDLNIGVSGVDPLFSWLPGATRLDGDDPMSRLSHASVDQVLHIAQVLGTDIVNAPLGFTVPETQQETIDSFGKLCEQAAVNNLRVTLEFMPFTDVANLTQAFEIVSGANCANGGIMFDCWHHHRSGGTPQALLEIDGEKIFAVQMDDALAQPMDDIVTETLNHRLLPGEGCIDLIATLQNLASSGAKVVYDVEVFKESLRSLDNPTRASMLHQSASAVLASL